MDGWKTILSFWGTRPIFRGKIAVSFREGKSYRFPERKGGKRGLGWGNLWLLDKGPFLAVGFLVDVFCSVSKESVPSQEWKHFWKKIQGTLTYPFTSRHFWRLLCFFLFSGCMFSRSPGGPYRLSKLTSDMVEYSSRLALPFLDRDS